MKGKVVNGDQISAQANAPGANKAGPESPSRLIDARIGELNDWRGETLARIRALIN